MKDEKYIRIINSALKEFADKGYELASTNVIAKNAHVSKGLIFKYFKTKENLYIESFAKAVEQIQSEFKNFQNLSNEKDFFEILKSWGLKKLQLLYEKPVLSKFLLTSLDVPMNIFEKIKSTYSKILEINISTLYTSFSKLPLRKDIPKEKTFEFVMEIFKLFGDNYVKKFYQRSNELMEKREEIFRDWEFYLEIIKNGVLSRHEEVTWFKSQDNI